VLQVWKLSLWVTGRHDVSLRPLGADGLIGEGGVKGRIGESRGGVCIFWCVAVGFGVHPSHVAWHERVWSGAFAKWLASVDS